MELKLNQLKDLASKGIKTPSFDVEGMIEKTKKDPTWVHFGAGNIFRGFIANLQNTLLEKGLSDKGIIAAETFDFDIIDKIYTPYDNLTLLVSLNADGSTKNSVVASIAEGVKGNLSDEMSAARLREIFENPSLQMISFTITEKGYALTNASGEVFPFVAKDFENGPKSPSHAMSVVTSLLYTRYQKGQYPLAVVSMDNCSHNGEKVELAVKRIAKEWLDRGYVDAGFVAYVADESKISFPWSMIDKITPRPSEEVKKNLDELGVENMAPIVTSKNTFIAPYVNAEVPEYLVVEDKFPNGRPALEEAGVYFTDRDTVNNTETMKVTTCLNPLHTALAVYGCVLGFDSIYKEMNDPQLKALVEKIGYVEGMPVVVDPKIIKPESFIKEVIEERLPNPFIPDMPQRIATDTSQKVAIRFGETIKSYAKREDLSPKDLTFIPLALAGWMRYLLGVNDKMEAFELSSDPMLSELQGKLAGIKVGDVDSYKGQLKNILSNAVIFGVDLYEVGLGDKVEGMFLELIAGKDAVRNTLVKYLG
ncbi:mannitol dehydrogenase family protein [Proteiniclasticum ruminis]|uniref:Fructuronate reductase n=1 Tax=Proteiniclasticum ruminis TaxID=398199 RepID=A0A1I5E915_9CLOT|nr:mannitol dehydrogenase family protein [Proteiniclasticum ruminis]SFO07947.1 fructuronate reductase [Proteiniclasticum ruminis]